MRSSAYLLVLLAVPMLMAGCGIHAKTCGARAVLLHAGLLLPSHELKYTSPACLLGEGRTHIEATRSGSSSAHHGHQISVLIRGYAPAGAFEMLVVKDDEVIGRDRSGSFRTSIAQYSSMLVLLDASVELPVDIAIIDTRGRLVIKYAIMPI